MWYGTIRLIVGTIVFIVIVVLVSKSHCRKKRGILIFSLVATMILTSLSSLVPIENVFIHFSTPEKAFYYSASGTITGVMEGEQSAIILHRGNDASSSSFIPKGKKGWKIGTFFTYREIASKLVDTRMITITNVKNTDDYYVTVWDPFATNIVEITDSEGSNFQYIEDEHKSTPDRVITYYTYVKGLAKGYTMTIDGETIKLL